MKQHLLFKDEKGDDEGKSYTRKITAPIYEPKNKKPHIGELCDSRKYQRLIADIERSEATEEEKKIS